MNGRTAKANRTEWTALFLASAELVRLRYVVSFTMGNRTPMADLMVGDPASGKQFWVDVKGMAGRGSSGWFAREKATLDGLFYILVSVGDDRAADKFFILSQESMNSLIREYRAAHQRSNSSGDGITWAQAQPHESQWDVLRD
jgi:hypothetical protein